MYIPIIIIVHASIVCCQINIGVKPLSRFESIQLQQKMMSSKYATGDALLKLVQRNKIRADIEFRNGGEIRWYPLLSSDENIDGQDIERSNSVSGNVRTWPKLRRRQNGHKIFAPSLPSRRTPFYHNFVFRSTMQSSVKSTFTCSHSNEKERQSSEKTTSICSHSTEIQSQSIEKTTSTCSHPTETQSSTILEGNETTGTTVPADENITEADENVTMLVGADTYEEESTTHTASHINISKSPKYTYRKLSPYSLARQIPLIASMFPQANITQEILGRTKGYNDIVLLKVTKSDISFRRDDDKYEDIVIQKYIIFIVHGLSIMGYHDLPCMSDEFEFERVLRYYFKHLDKFDFFVIPMANPDGVAVPFRVWNKNASPQSACPGVALDRNFDIHWNWTHKKNSCSQQYPGPFPFSEIETRAIKHIIRSYSNKIAGYFHVHSGTYTSHVFKGDAVLYPRGFAADFTEDDRYIDLQTIIQNTLRNATFKTFTVPVETLYNWYGKVHGTSVDFASAYGIPYSLELVMQIYDKDQARGVDLEQEILTYASMLEVWPRVLDVIFNSIHDFLTVNKNNLV